MSTHRDPATDQPEPIQTSEPSVHDLVIDVIRERKNLGMRKYGTVLQASNGRDHLTDAIEEAADLLAYLAAERETRRIRTERTPTLREAVARAIYEAACPPAEDAPTGTRWEEWHETDEPNREEWREIADAVLAVLPRTEAQIKAEALQEFSDLIATGPSSPMPASIFAALAHEKAEQYKRGDA